MKTVLKILLMAALAAGGVWIYSLRDGADRVRVTLPPPTAVYFSPKGGCTAAVCHAIDEARQEVLVQSYSFTSVPISNALLAAHQRGLAVVVILDDGMAREKNGEGPLLAQEGVRVYTDAAHAIAHNKVMILDGKTVLTGSFNYTNAAENANAENLLRIDDPALAQKYRANWLLHWGHSHALVPTKP